jgi:group I intron endonuclease
MRSGLIYLITNTVNQREYIGKTTSGLQERWSEHKRAAKKGSKTAIHAAIRKYGPDAFTVDTIADNIPSDWLDAVEIAFISAAKTFGTDHGYNLTPGGDGQPAGTAHPSYGIPLSPERRAKISVAHIGKTVSVETRAKLSAASTGTKHSAETRAKMSASRTGVKRPREVVAKMVEARTGKKLSNSSSRHHGVSYHKRFMKWTAQIRLEGGKLKHICYATDELSAAQAVDSYIIEHGLSNTLNFPVSELLVSC